MASERVVGFEDLRDQLRITNKLLVLLLQKTHELAKSQMTQSQLIVEIAAAGAPPSEIAMILDTTINTVQVTLSRDRHRKRR